MKFVDNFLDTITMYRLVLYYLLLLLGAAFIYCVVGILHFNPLLLVFSAVFLVAVCWTANKVFSKAFGAPTNVESAYISALILALILTPAQSLTDVMFLFWAGVLAMASKYILAIGKKHIFNPVAIAVTVTAFAGVGSASWWVGTICMLPFALLGLVIVRKLRRYDLVFYFFIAAFAAIGIFTMIQGHDLFVALKATVVASSIFFFGFVMLTEPLTTPPTKKLQAIYGAIVGVLFAPQLHIGSFYTTPEMALAIGNVFSYIVSPKTKIVATLLEKHQISSDIFDFGFAHGFAEGKQFAFAPGQYMEWTLSHPRTDSRGNRRFFTIASSPTEKILRLGIRFYPNGSSFKKALLALQPPIKLVGGQIGGDFTLPNDKNQKLVFIAGGIGVTPFRSMMKFLVDTNDRRQIVMFYVNKQASEIAYVDVFNQAQQQLGIKMIYTLTDQATVPANWQGKVGRIDQNLIQQEVSDFKERTFYLSGPHAMVVAYEEILRSMGVSERHIKKDFFPGLV